MIETARLMRPQSLQRARAVFPVRRTVGLEVVNTDFLRGMHVPAGLGVGRRNMAGCALCGVFEHLLAALRRVLVETTLRRLRSGNSKLIEMQGRELAADQIGVVAHVAEPSAGRNGELGRVIQAREEERALAVHLEIGDTRVPM